MMVFALEVHALLHVFEASQSRIPTFGDERWDGLDVQFQR